MIGVLIAVLSWFAMAGFLASAAVHCAAVYGVAAHEFFPFVWFLHLGIFVVFAPAIFLSKGVGNRSEFWKVLPPALRYPLFLLFAYTFFNFFAGVQSLPSGSWSVSEDKTSYSFTPKGGSSQTATKQEYDKAQAATDRLFSGHWMLFYFAAFALLRATSAKRFHG